MVPVGGSAKWIISMAEREAWAKVTRPFTSVFSAIIVAAASGCTLVVTLAVVLGAGAKEIGAPGAMVGGMAFGIVAL